MKQIANKCSEMGLDAFLDIITNVIGVLILIACAIALQIRDFQPPQKTPISISAPEKAKKHQFMCSRNRVVEIKHADIYSQMETRANRELGTEQTWQQFVDFVKSGIQWSEKFSVDINLDQNGIVEIVYELKPGDPEWVDPFAETLSSANKGDVIFFYVYDDSFDEFRRARKMAKDAGFSVGWKPIPGKRLYYRVRDPNPSNRHSSSWEVEQRD